MKKTGSLFLAAVLLLALLSGCGAERVKVDISDGGDLSGAPTAEPAGPIESSAAETAPQRDEFLWQGCRLYISYILDDGSIPAGTYTLSGKAVRVCLVCAEGLLSWDDVSKFSEGFQLKGPDGTVYEPFSCSWSTFGSENFALSDLDKMQFKGVFPNFDIPADGDLSEYRLLVRTDEGQREFSLAGVPQQAPETIPDPVLTETGPAGKEPDALPEGWYQTVERSEEGSDVDWTETITCDEKGRRREYVDVKRSEEYAFSVEFRDCYTYTEGSPVVEYTGEFFEYDLESGALKGYGKATFSYTMRSPDNHIELWSGWSETGELDENGIMGQKLTDYGGTEYGPDGAEILEIPYTEL